MKTKILTTRLGTGLVDRVKQEAEAQRVGVAELLRRALVSYLRLDPEQKRHRETMYEVVKTRAFMVQLAETQMDEAQVEKLLTQAEEAATGYLAERGM